MEEYISDSNELFEMNIYLKELNEKLERRPLGNLITCPECHGRGGFFSYVCDPPFMKCNKCKGKKYIKIKRKKK